MTTKRKRPGGPLLLICAAAKRGQNCRYREVRDEYVTAAFMKHREAIFAERPRAGRGIKADAVRIGMESAVDAIDDLLSGHQGLRPAASGEHRERLVAERQQLEKAISRTHHDREWFARTWGHGRFELEVRAVKRRLRGTLTDVTATNRELLRVFEAVTPDYRTGELRFRWRNGRESSIMFAWPEEPPS